MNPTLKVLVDLAYALANPWLKQRACMMWGAPNSGKSKLMEYISDALKEFTH